VPSAEVTRRAAGHFHQWQESCHEAVDIGHELLRKKNSQAEHARMRVEDVYAALYAGARGRAS